MLFYYWISGSRSDLINWQLVLRHSEKIFKTERDGAVTKEYFVPLILSLYHTVPRVHVLN